ncbi:MAG: hypothetical protein WC455_11220 [Dehalococcoidia bacterium]|jgi:hypothetical protein
MADMTKILRKLQDGLTVADLIDELRNYDENALVLFACDYGDHCHTQQALPIRTVDEYHLGVLEESAYSHSGVSFREPDERDEDCPDMDRSVIILEASR